MVLRYRFEGLIFGGAFTWRGLFSEFYGIQLLSYFLAVQCTIIIILCEHSWGVSSVKPPKHKAKDKWFWHIWRSL